MPLPLTKPTRTVTAAPITFSMNRGSAVPIWQAGPLRNDPQQPELEDSRPDMPRIALHFAANPVRAILAFGKIALFLFFASFGLTALPPKGRSGPIRLLCPGTLLVAQLLRRGGRPDDRQQCAPGRRFAFVVHGLWPQYTKGWPEFCRTRENWIPQDSLMA